FAVAFTNARKPYRVAQEEQVRHLQFSSAAAQCRRACFHHLAEDRGRTSPFAKQLVFACIQAHDVVVFVEAVKTKAVTWIDGRTCIGFAVGFGSENIRASLELRI